MFSFTLVKPKQILSPYIHFSIEILLFYPVLCLSEEGLRVSPVERTAVCAAEVESSEEDGKKKNKKRGGKLSPASPLLSFASCSSPRRHFLFFLFLSHSLPSPSPIDAVGPRPCARGYCCQPPAQDEAAAAAAEACRRRCQSQCEGSCFVRGPLLGRDNEADLRHSLRAKPIGFAKKLAVPASQLCARCQDRSCSVVGI